MLNSSHYKIDLEVEVPLINRTNLGPRQKVQKEEHLHRLNVNEDYRQSRRYNEADIAIHLHQDHHLVETSTDRDVQNPTHLVQVHLITGDILEATVHRLLRRHHYADIDISINVNGTFFVKWKFISIRKLVH